MLNNTSVDEMLNALTINAITLHDGLPGVDGLSNVVSVAAESVVFAAAADNGDGKRSRSVNAEVTFDGMTPLESVTHFGLWESGSDDTYRGYIIRSIGATAVDSAGRYIVTTDTKIVIGHAA